MLDNKRRISCACGPCPLPLQLFAPLLAPVLPNASQRDLPKQITSSNEHTCYDAALPTRTNCRKMPIALHRAIDRATERTARTNVPRSTPRSAADRPLALVPACRHGRGASRHIGSAGSCESGCRGVPANRAPGENGSIPPERSRSLLAPTPRDRRRRTADSWRRRPPSFRSERDQSGARRGAAAPSVAIARMLQLADSARQNSLLTGSINPVIARFV